MKNEGANVAKGTNEFLAFQGFLAEFTLFQVVADLYAPLDVRTAATSD